MKIMQRGDIKAQTFLFYFWLLTYFLIQQDKKEEEK